MDIAPGGNPVRRSGDQMNRNVVIIGAGIVGLVLAKELASRDIGVTVYDGKKEVGEGACKASGVVSVGGIEGTGMEYKDAIMNELRGAVISAGRRKLEVKSDSVKAYVFDRERLSRMFYRQAVDKGAEVVLGARMGREEIRKLEDPVIVGADGAVSTVASAFGFPGINEYALTYKKEYREAKVDDKEVVGVYFDRSAKRFFGWTIPYSDSVVEAGIGISGNGRRDSSTAFRKFISSGQAKEVEGGKAHGRGFASLIPLRTRSITALGNVILVGDAAGQVKSSTGGGIVFGALCAKVAADAIERHMRNGNSLAAYEAMWRKRYGRELAIHRAVHNAYSLLGEGGMEGFLRMGSALGLGGFLSRHGDMDHPSLMLKRLFSG